MNHHELANRESTNEADVDMPGCTDRQHKHTRDDITGSNKTQQMFVPLYKTICHKAHSAYIKSLQILYHANSCNHVLQVLQTTSIAFPYSGHGPGI